MTALKTPQQTENCSKFSTMSDAPRHDLEYRTPQRTSGGAVRLIGQLALWYTHYAAIMFVMVFVVPRFEGTFASFRVTLSWPTILLLRASRLCTDRYFWLWLSPAPAVLAVILARRGTGGSKPGRGPRLLATLFMTAFLLFVGYGLGRPLMGLIDHLSAGK
jgi:hypothetical protein